MNRYTFTETTAQLRPGVFETYVKGTSGEYTDTRSAYRTINGDVYAICSRCDGTGHYAWNGDHDWCYRCGGDEVESTAATAEQLLENAKETVRRTIRLWAKRDAAYAARQILVDTWKADNSEFIARLRTYEESGISFLETGNYRLDAFLGGDLEASPVSGTYRAALVRAMDDHDARKAESAANPVPSGRETVTGRIISFKEVEDRYSYYGGQIVKMLVEDDRGWRVFGTVPSALSGAERGDRVTFTAALEASEKDPGFGFFKRPTKAQIV